MKRNIKRGLFYFILGFAGLFLLRLIYGFIAYPNGVEHQVYRNVGGLASTSFKGYSKRNIASKKVQRSNGTQLGNIDQKYEKVAAIHAKSSVFDKDEVATRRVIKDFNALIQFEQSSGLRGNRVLSLAIGVDPTKFDAITDTLSKIGTLTSVRIDKSDKTSEFKELNAKKAALEKIRDNLVALKKRGGKIDEFVTLENRIFEIEEKIQTFGLNLGEFDEENEFCTVKYALKEVAKSKTSIPLSSRLKTAFEWTVKFYFGLVSILFFAALCSLIIVVLIEKLTPVVRRYWR